MRLAHHSRVFALLLGGACFGSSACSSDDGAEAPASADAKEAKLATRLEGDTGVGSKVIVERQTNAVRFLAPIAATDRATTGTSPEDKARSFFQKYAADLGMTDQEQLRVKDETTDSYGHRSIRFEHVLAGTELPIFDSSSLAEFTPDGSLLHIQPGFREDLSKVARTATITQTAAEQTAIDDVRGACALAPADIATRKTSTLGVAAEPDAPAVLAWAVDVRTTFGACVAPRVFVDARTGAVLRMRETASFVIDRVGGVRFHSLNEANDLKSIDVTATTDLFGNNKWTMESSGPKPKVQTFAYSPAILANFVDPFTSPVETYLLGNWDITSPYQGAAVDGHYYAGKALEYFKIAHNRSGLDGNSANLTVVVHDPEPNSRGRNAHYADYGVLFNDDQLHVGDGGAGWIPLSAGFDVMAHELAHGVTNRTSGLVYRGESGALNEAFSDVMGAAAENWLPETRDAVKNVLIGERMTIDGRGIRNMADPSEDLGGKVRDGIDHYKLMPACPTPTDSNDHCGVHTNSGIANRAFTLMVLGGLHKGSKVAVAKGVGWEKGRELWYNSFTKLGPNSNFATAAYTQLAIATTRGVEFMTAVACAWFAVGVFDPVDLSARNVVCVGSNPTSAPPPAAPAPPSSASGGGCNGRTSGYVCNDGAPGFATPCNASAMTVYCADTAQRCKRASASDATATVGSTGVLTCE